MTTAESATRKFYLLEGRSREIAQRVEQIVASHDKMGMDELKDARDYLGLFTGTLMGFDAEGSRVDYYPACPTLFRAQTEPENYYLRTPVSDYNGMHVTPKDAVEITDPQQLARLDSLFVGGADVIYCHEHSQAPFTTAEHIAPVAGHDEGPFF